MDSRVLSTRVLGNAISRCASSPRVWLNASTATIYKHSLDRPMTEEGEIGATRPPRMLSPSRSPERGRPRWPTHRHPATRKVALRTAMVLSTQSGSVFPVLRRLVRFGLGGSMAGGRQFVSWIHEEDFCGPFSGSSLAMTSPGR